MAAAQWEGCPQGTFSTCWSIPWAQGLDSQQQNHMWGLIPPALFGCSETAGLSACEHASGAGRKCEHAHNWLLTGVPPQAYVNMALFENFTYAGIDATAEEA